MSPALGQPCRSIRPKTKCQRASPHRLWREASRRGPPGLQRNSVKSSLRRATGIRYALGVDRAARLFDWTAFGSPAAGFLQKVWRHMFTAAPRSTRWIGSARAKPGPNPDVFVRRHHLSNTRVWNVVASDDKCHGQMDLRTITICGRSSTFGGQMQRVDESGAGSEPAPLLPKNPASRSVFR